MNQIHTHKLPTGGALQECDCPNPYGQLPEDTKLNFEPRHYIVRCCHKVKAQVLSVGFWFGMTLGFPLEHFLYEKVWPFTWIAHILNLH